MQKAKKNKFFARFFYFYLHYYLIKKHFSAIHVVGKLHHSSNTPVIHIANHSSWWDGLLLFYLIHQTSLDSHYMMMDEEGIKKYPFFRKLGAFSVNRNKPKDLLRTFKYCETLLHQNKNIWLFPQGRIQHQDVAITFERGLTHLLDKNPTASIQIVTLHYYFTEKQKPSVSILCSNLIDIDDGNTSTHIYEQAMTNQISRQKNMIIKEEMIDFTELLKPSKSTSDWLDWWKRQ